MILYICKQHCSAKISNNRFSVLVMSEKLELVDQNTPLPKLAQCYYYCAISVLLTMGDEYNEYPYYEKASRAEVLMNLGLLN